MSHEAPVGRLQRLTQFATLEPPVGEAGVLRLDALLPIEQLQAQAAAWLNPAEVVR